jgi:RNA polymerase sigma factor (sigma-70 family)
MRTESSPKQPTRREKKQNRLIPEIYELAGRHAAGLVGRQRRADVVHDVILECIEIIRAGEWTAPGEGLDRFVQYRVWSRRNSAYRTRRRDAVRDAEFLRVIDGAPREWMSEDLLRREEEAGELQRRVSLTLPAKWRRVHRLVRDERLTYEQCANTVGISTSTVHKYIHLAQAVYRRAMSGVSIAELKKSMTKKRRKPRRRPRPAVRRRLRAA